jgi:CubicO group peptidase (beta-lactamase class C family)
MKKSSCVAIVAGLLVGGAVAQAQVPLKPGIPNVLTWTQGQQKAWYPKIETVYRTSTVKRGATVRPLPNAATEIAPTVSIGGRSYTVDEYMKAFNVSGVLVLKDGKILMERYGFGRRPQDRWTSFSVTKSLTSTLVGAAIRDGRITSLDDPVTRYIPELKGSAYEGVTVRHLLTMSSGVKWNEDYSDPNSDVAQAGQQILEPGVNPIVSYMRRLPRAELPGSRFNYNTGETDLAGILVSNATGKSLSDYASEKVWKPAGMEQDAIWVLDLVGHERGGCCMSMTLRDYGRFGQFMLEARTGKQPLLPSGWAKEATSPQITNGAPAPGFGYFWWMRPGGYAAEGIFGQSIVTYPDDRLVVVFNSAWPAADAAPLWDGQQALADAIRIAAMHR